MKRTTKREGFTLVELLIVIVVIGILSAMMMLSSTEAVTSAKASNIVSNLRNLKTAALAYYVDHMDAMEGAKDVKAGTKSITTPGAFTFAKGSFSQDVAQYLNNNITDKGYGVSITKNGEWYVTYTIASGASTATEQAGIITKLKGRAKSVGLCTNETSKDFYGKTDGDTTIVGMFVR